MIEKSLSRVGLKPGTTRSVGQHLTHCKTRVPGISRGIIFEYALGNSQSRIYKGQNRSTEILSKFVIQITLFGTPVVGRAISPPSFHFKM